VIRVLESPQALAVEYPERDVESVQEAGAAVLPGSPWDARKPSTPHEFVDVRR
jgi:hypothetical protein